MIPQTREAILKKEVNTFWFSKRKAINGVDLEWEYIMWKEQQERQVRKKMVECAILLAEKGQLSEEKCEIFLKSQLKERIHEYGEGNY